MTKRQTIFLHLSFWLISILIRISLYLPEFSFVDINSYLNHLSGDIIALSFFYINYFFAVPKLLLKRKWTYYATFFVLLSWAYVVLTLWFWDGWRNFSVFPDVGQDWGVLFNLQIYFVVGTGIKLINHWTESEKEKFLLEKEMKDSELLYLKSQMSPHFLFNTLNNIYGLSLNESKDTKDAIFQLKRMMQYDVGGNEKVSLKKELAFLQDFVNLNRLRYDVEIIFNSNVDDENQLIEPMLLLPFIENAFKHGGIRSNEMISIQLNLKNKVLSYEVVNSVNSLKRKDDTGGIGIVNVKRRLDLIYAGKYKLELDEGDALYKVILNIEL